MKKAVCCAVLTALAFGAGAAEWFDAGIAGYSSWPSQGQDFSVSGVGTWTETSLASRSLEDGAARLSVVAQGVGEPLAFTTLLAKTFDAKPAVSSRVVISSLPKLLSVTPSAKGALTAVATSSDGPAYYGLAADAAGGTNGWVRLSGAVPAAGSEVLFEVFFRTEGDSLFVRYAVDGAALSRDGAEWLPTIPPEGSALVSKVKYLGTGEVRSLAGAADERFTALTIPALVGMSVASVSVLGEEIETDEDGSYRILSGAPVVVAFAPDAGYVLRGDAMGFTALGETMELPEEGRPVALEARFLLRINEVMASNGSTLATAGGVAGLDWLEIQNESEMDIDASGWFLSGDPAQAPGGRAVIEGPATVPAGGYLIVWLDPSFADWDGADAHAALGLSSDGGTISLATPEGAVVDRYALGRQFDDVSFGYGHITRSLVSATGPAEYRVGDGDWTPAFGPIGMTAGSNAFTVVTYVMNNVTVTSIDNVESYLSSRYLAWYLRAGYPRMDAAETIAFQDVGSSYSDFAPYSAFPGDATGDNFFFVATGSVFVPRAGKWTFAVGSDDGFSCTISHKGESWTFESRGARSYGHTASTLDLPEAGVYEVRLVYFEYGGDAGVDFSVAEGQKGYSAADFRLVGSAESGVIHSGLFGPEVSVDLADEMAGKSASVDWRSSFTLSEAPAEGDAFRLRIRYADGFTAKLNGVEFASVPATGARSPADALEYVYFDVPAGLVRAGENTLVVTGYNDGADDTEFFLSPELLWDVAAEQLLYFPEPTPGAANGAGRSAPTPKVAFSEPHGYKTGPVTVEITCADDPDATIRYTTDGTSPTAASARYTGPLTISSTTVLRAAVPDADSILQQDASASYLYLADILRQEEGVVPADFPASGAVNGQTMIYGLRGSIVNGDAATKAKLDSGFTNTIQTISLVIDPRSLFDRSRGIYVNADGTGREWERPTMVEQIDPVNGASKEFSVPAGIRIRGASSRGSDRPKHSLRLFFRGEYGMDRLAFPLFGGEGADDFEEIDLQTAQDYSWANGDTDRFTLVEDVFSRDSQRDMGEPYGRSRYCSSTASTGASTRPRSASASTTPRATTAGAGPTTTSCGPPTPATSRASPRARPRRGSRSGASRRSRATGRRIRATTTASAASTPTARATRTTPSTSTRRT